MTAHRWRPSLSPAERDVVRALLTDVERADGVAPVGEQVLRNLDGARAEHLLVPDEHGVLTGYLNLAPDGTAELAVHPAFRRRGVGASLVTAALERGGDSVRFWAHGTLPAAKAMAATLHLRAARELIQMRRPLSEIPRAAVPQGVSIKSYHSISRYHSGADAELLRVNNAAFSWHPEQGGWTDRDIADRISAPWFDPAGLFLAFDDDTGTLCGFHWTKVHDDMLGEVVGEVYVLGVDPGAQGRGLGRTLTLRGLEYLAERLGAESEVMLYVESDNVAAITTYESLGFRRCSIDTGYVAG
ncbi:MAG: mycothiol synthase [Mycobacterium sp.]|nr:mycothiol synthase [Mycobacterium sp.]